MFCSLSNIPRHVRGCSIQPADRPRGARRNHEAPTLRIGITAHEDHIRPRSHACFARLRLRRCIEVFWACPSISRRARCALPCWWDGLLLCPQTCPGLSAHPSEGVMTMAISHAVPFDFSRVDAVHGKGVPCLCAGGIGAVSPQSCGTPWAARAQTFARATVVKRPTQFPNYGRKAPSRARSVAMSLGMVVARNATNDFSAAVAGGDLK